LERRKYSQPFCGTCMSRSMHQLFTGVPVSGATEEAVRILGPLYRAFDLQNRMIGSPAHIVTGNRFHSLDEIYLAGLSALSRDDDDTRAEAERCFGLLTDQAPHFGEGFFQAARLAARRGDTDRAAALMGEAVRLAPDHALYRSELETLGSRLSAAVAEA
jgi:hypothetical protein